MNDEFYGANFGKGQLVSPLRALPHEAAFEGEDYLEVLDYERASEIIATNEKISLGICSCRHEAFHLGTKKCDTPLETCMSFGFSADYLARNSLARPIEAAEALDIVARARDTGLSLCADNVRNGVSFMCSCCKCCCRALAGIRDYGYASAVMTSNFIAERDPGKCAGCGACASACTINAVSMVDTNDVRIPGGKIPIVDESFCLGCGVCATRCPTGAMRLKPRESGASKVIHPYDVFERIILRSLENGTLQNQIFTEPGNLSQKFLRGVVGGFLRLPPVKGALMSDALRSRFLGALAAAREARSAG
jgi:ferredoxin